MAWATLTSLRGCDGQPQADGPRRGSTPRHRSARALEDLLLPLQSRGWCKDGQHDASASTSCSAPRVVPSLVNRTYH